MHHRDTHASAIAATPLAARRLVARSTSGKGGFPWQQKTWQAHDLEDMGPVDYVLIEFPDGEPKGKAAPLLVDLVDED